MKIASGNCKTTWNKNNIRIIGTPGGEKKEQGIETMFEKNNDRKLPKSGDGESHARRKSTEGPTQDEPKEAYSKTHHN